MDQRGAFRGSVWSAWRGSALVWCAVGSYALLGCGGAGQPAQASDASDDATGAAVPAQLSPEERAIVDRLKGRWEILRFESQAPIPSEAMPAMAAMFDALKVTFDEREMGTESSKSSYSIEAEAADRFVLRTEGGMFDGASARFTDEDEVEIVDEGPSWPGTTVLVRLE